jgi:hypothetical protein
MNNSTIERTECSTGVLEKKGRRILPDNGQNKNRDTIYKTKANQLRGQKQNF